MSENPRERVGGNFPPLDHPTLLRTRLERDHAELIRAAAALELKLVDLPDAPADDAQCGALTEYVVEVKRLAKRVDDVRKEAKEPYLEGGRTVDAWFKELGDPLAGERGLVARVTPRITAYNRAKEERERAERRRQEEAARVAAAEAARKAQEERLAAERAAAEAEEAARRLRAAETDEARAAAFSDMQSAETVAQAARSIADDQEKYAAQHERKADQHAAAAERGGLGRVATGAATSSVTKVWVGQITDAPKLFASLGPLGPYLPDAEIRAAIDRAVRQAAAQGRVADLTIPGVRVFEDIRTNFRATR